MPACCYQIVPRKTCCQATDPNCQRIVPVDQAQGSCWISIGSEWWESRETRLGVRLHPLADFTSGASCLPFAGNGKVKVHHSLEPLEAINDIFGRMRGKGMDGRVVIKI